MDILAFPAEKFLYVLFMLVLITAVFSLIYIMKMYRFGGLDYAGMTYDFFKFVFYGVLAWLTLYFNFNQETKEISYSLKYKNLSLAEMLVIILSVFEMISNVISIFNRFGNISVSWEIDNQKNQKKIEEDKKYKIMIEEINMKIEKQRLERKLQLERIRIERLNKYKKKKV